jgi:hypothetical protein
MTRLSVERQRFEHLQQRGRGLASRRARIAPPRKSSVSTLARHFRRDFLEFQIGDITGERCRFIGHARYVRLSLAMDVALSGWSRSTNLIESVAQSPDVSEFNVVKYCSIVLLRARVLGNASSLKGAPAR